MLLQKMVMYQLCLVCAVQIVIVEITAIRESGHISGDSWYRSEWTEALSKLSQSAWFVTEATGRLCPWSLWIDLQPVSTVKPAV